MANSLHYEAFRKEENAVRLAFCTRAPDGSRLLVDYDLKCRALNIGMECPTMVSEAPGASISDEGAGVGSGSTTVVVNTSSSQNETGVLGNNMVSGAGVDGVVSNVFNKEELVKVDVEPTLRRDLCCETYACLGCCAGGHAWFFKLPDCLGGGCNSKNLCGEGALTCKILQKPTFCECVEAFTCLDMSTCCSNKGENDDVCCKFLSWSGQYTCCCLFQEACRCQYALMRTCVKCWCWFTIIDYRCSVPPSSSSPMQCTLCGFGYRWYEHGGCGCRVRADNDAASAGTTTNTTVVVVNS